MQALYWVICGVLIGVANIIPGVSGGTMAVILKVFDRMIEALSLKNLKQNWLFILCVGVGAGAGILAFSKAIKFLLLHYPMATNFTFIGLILGSIPMIFKRAKEGSKQKNGTFAPFSLVSFVAMFALMVGLSIINEGSLSNTVQTTMSVGTFIWLMACAAISTFAMILPGISGSFVMLLLGAYMTVITAVSDLNFIILLPFAIGAVIGLVLGSRLVSVLLEKNPQATYCAILGLIVGSLIAIYPGFAFNIEGLVSIGLMVVAALVALWFSREPEPGEKR